MTKKHLLTGLWVGHLHSGRSCSQLHVIFRQQGAGLSGEWDEKIIEPQMISRAEFRSNLMGAVTGASVMFLETRNDGTLFQHQGQMTSCGKRLVGLWQRLGTAKSNGRHPFKLFRLTDEGTNNTVATKVRVPSLIER